MAVKMHQKYTPDALDIRVPVPEGTKANEPIKVGRITGVTMTDRQTDGTATVRLRGSWLADNVAGAVAQFGGPVYIKLSDRTLAGAAGTGLELWGTALGTKTGSDGPLEVVPDGYGQN